ncbi:MAG: fatty acid cistrans isomerase [Verrucomicrobiaceae bacterium]|nr:fatty acid cistrans isomerase [Verrucomicrobiaceae bacterium]
MKSWRLAAIWLAIALIGIGLAWYWHRSGIERAALAARDVPVVTEGGSATASAEFYRDVKPIFDRRCLVCHGCYDAPCQLKLDSPEGIQRGATSAKVYDSSRLFESATTRLFVDAQSAAQWRDKGFFSVLNEGEQTREKNLDDSVLYQMLALKQEHPQPEDTLPTSIDLSIERKEFCPTADSFSEYAQKHPLQGMPFALPGLSAEEFATMKRWLEGGAKVTAPTTISASAQQQTTEWERFLNRDDVKTRLMSRYLFEHLFLADVYFGNDDTREFFKLVRSRTAPGTPIDLIATRRPFDDPGIERVFYRLQPVRATLVAKTHLPYLFDAKRMHRFDELFLQPDYRIDNLPSYAPETAANPFITYAALPVQTRYRFMLDEAGFFIDSFIKGPVCRGQIALNVIDDRFWVVFANPDAETKVDAQFLAQESKQLAVPSELGNKPLGFTQWQKYADMQADYLGAKEKFLFDKFGAAHAVTQDLIWSGDGGNLNAALTVFRHFDNASVVQGLVGEVPKTAWVIDYPMLERIHYLLVAGFDVYGDASHQLVTRLYMDYLRMEGETNFLSFLPKNRREAERNSWYQGVGAKTRDSVYRKVGNYQRETGISYHSKNPKQEFFDLLKARFGAALSQHYAMNDASLPEPARTALEKIGRVRGRAAAYLPEVVLLRVVIRGDSDRLYTILHNADYANVALLFLDKERRRPQFDNVTLVPGIIGAYPNAFWVVNETDLPQLARQLSAVEGPNSYNAVAQRFGIARTNPRFWQESDWILNTYRNLEPIEWGVLDYNRYVR